MTAGPQPGLRAVVHANRPKGDRASLAFDPVNTWTLMLAVAVDLGRQHAARPRRARK